MAKEYISIFFEQEGPADEFIALLDDNPEAFWGEMESRYEYYDGAGDCEPSGGTGDCAAVHTLDEVCNEYHSYMVAYIDYGLPYIGIDVVRELSPDTEV